MIRRKDNSVLITGDDFKYGQGNSKWTGFGNLLCADIFSEPGVLKNGHSFSEDTGIEITSTILGAAHDPSQATHTSYWAYLSSTNSVITKRVGNGVVGTWTEQHTAPFAITKMTIFNGHLYYVGLTALGRYKLNSSVTMTIASPCVVTYTGHGLSAGMSFRFRTTGALPTGVTAGTTYYVISAGLTADAFQFSTSAGGAAVNSSGTQSGTHTIWVDGFQTLNSGIHDMVEQETSLYIGNVTTIAEINSSNVFSANVLDIPSSYSILYLAPFETDLVFTFSGANSFEGTRAGTMRWDTVSSSWDILDFFSANTHHGWAKGGDVLFYVYGYNPVKISYYDGSRLILIKELTL